MTETYCEMKFEILVSEIYSIYNIKSTSGEDTTKKIYLQNQAQTSAFSKSPRTNYHSLDFVSCLKVS
ncbi:Ubiquitin Carboxyl-Terminal Hydrolase 26 [Manis pentadactyla]|nr:Ubiquitin Carboxyl-Terminal Hydrolase 26 [Manis pentadactyla]